MEVSLLPLPLMLGKESQAEIRGWGKVGYLKCFPSALVPGSSWPGQF